MDGVISNAKLHVSNIELFFMNLVEMYTGNKRLLEMNGFLFMKFRYKLVSNKG